MTILVTVKAGARKEKIEKVDETHFEIAVVPRAEKGRANKAVIGVLSEYFDVAPSRIQILSGFTGTLKKIEIL